VLGVQVGVRERVVEFRVGQAARMVCAGQGDEGRLAARELEQRRAHGQRVSQALVEEGRGVTRQISGTAGRYV
jgi:hypothetical protein